MTTTSKAKFKLPEKSRAEKASATRILLGLYTHYPDAHCELEYTNPRELLIATILSAQATDVSVNKATPALFKAFPAPADYAAATPEEIETYIKSIGLFRNKAKSIHAAMNTIAADFDGEAPRTMEELLTLRGVARKTANVVLGNAFSINEGVVVDTHVGRISRRLGLSAQSDPVKVERQLNECVPRHDWRDFGHLLIDHGRKTCKARAPQCDACALYRWCEVRA